MPTPPPAAAPLGPHGAAPPGKSHRRIEAGKRYGADGSTGWFTLRLGDEMANLKPGEAWTKVDEYKWVTRGVIEPPQSFRTLPDGSVEINGEKITLHDPEGVSKLEREINKHHDTLVGTHKPAPTTKPLGGAPAATKVVFRVYLDRLGHLMVGCQRGEERTETSLRGIQSLVANGLMLRPRHLQVDAMQRSVEIDGLWFDCTATGARALEDLLNNRFAPSLESDHEQLIEVKENPGASTGFDLHFVAHQASGRIEIKGHLQQDRLDLLCDQAKCDLLQHGIVLRLSPPNLLARRRRPDGGEERIPGLEDLPYRRVTAHELQEFLNHPLLRRSGKGNQDQAAAGDEARPGEVLEMRVVRDVQNPHLLWLEVVTTQGRTLPHTALTHHNIAELQHRGFFFSNFDTNLSLDNRLLSVLDLESRAERKVSLGEECDAAALAEAGALLTSALRPPAPKSPVPESASAGAAAPVVSPLPARDVIELDPGNEPGGSAERPAAEHGSAAEILPSSAASAPANLPTAQPQPPSVTVEVSAQTPAPGPKPPKPKEYAASTGSVAQAGGAPPRPHAGSVVPAPTVSLSGSPEPVSAPSERAPAPPRIVEVASLAGAARLDQGVLALFHEADPLRVNVAAFQRLGEMLGVAAQDVRLSLPRVFENRRFEVLSFGGEEIGSILDLRSEGFYGFYLSHNSEQNVLLVYACAGRHVEWGAHRCLLQASPAAEGTEFPGSALLGLAQDLGNNFVFVVEPAYRNWAKPHEKSYAEVSVVFRTPEDIALEPKAYTLIWPSAD